jgi:TRAP-type C4-dicarboxylate transport system permease small subunit
MLNHLYGVAGFAGLIVTLVTSYLKNDDLARWVLVISGWLACLIIAISTAWGTRRISQKLIDAMTKIGELDNLAREMREQRDAAQSISAYLAKVDFGKTATPRTAVPKDIEREKQDENKF